MVRFSWRIVFFTVTLARCRGAFVAGVLTVASDGFASGDVAGPGVAGAVRRRRFLRAFWRVGGAASARKNFAQGLITATNQQCKAHDNSRRLRPVTCPFLVPEPRQ